LGILKDSQISLVSDFFRHPSLLPTNTMSKKKSKKGKDSKFFSSNTKKGEIREILDELCNPKLDVQRDAIKRVIALMTVGKDVSMLFPQVVNCMQTSKYLLYPQSKSTMMVLTPCSVGFNAQVFK
jgi:hypothetical protein